MSEEKPPLPTFLTAIEVANMIRMSERTLENMRLDGRGPPYMRLGQGGRAKVIYELSDVMAWLKTMKK